MQCEAITFLPWDMFLLPEIRQQVQLHSCSVIRINQKGSKVHLE